MTATIYVDPQSQEHGLEAYMLIRQINAMLDTFNRYDLRGEDLTVPQFAILNHATPEGVPLSEISARMLCDNSNLTGIVDRLVSKGLVERRPDPQDRRVSLICLTPVGSEKLRQVAPRHHENVNRRMHALPSENVKQLRDLLHVLYESMGNELGLTQAPTAKQERTTPAEPTRAETVRARIDPAAMPNSQPMPRHSMRTRGRGNGSNGKRGPSHS